MLDQEVAPPPREGSRRLPRHPAFGALPHPAVTLALGLALVIGLGQAAGLQLRSLGIDGLGRIPEPALEQGEGEVDPGHWTSCMPMRSRDAPVTSAMDVLRNLSDSPARIESVSLIGARGISLVGADIAVVGEFGPLPGNGEAYPPRASSGHGGTTYRPAAGASVPPASEGKVANVVLGLALTGDEPGTVDSILVTYRHEGSRQAWWSMNGIKIVPAGSSCF